MTYRITTQEFQVVCTRVAGGMRRNPLCKDQDTERRTVYAKGRGSSVRSRRKNAERDAREVMACHGWDRFHAKLTIGDEELANAAYRDRYLQDSYIDQDISSKISNEEEWELLDVGETL